MSLVKYTKNVLYMFLLLYICFMKDIDFDYQGFADEFRKTLTYGDSVRKISKEICVSPPTIWRALKGNKIDLITALKMANKMNRNLKDFVVKK